MVFGPHEGFGGSLSKFPSPKEYYELSENPSKKDDYEKLLKILSNKTTSRDYFKESSANKIYQKRKQLHEKIIKTYIANYNSKKKPTIHFLLGSIGSGKTSAKDKIIEKDNKKDFLYINFDDIKLKLPEYKKLKQINPKKAAQFVQSESSRIAGNLFKNSIKKGINIIYEKNLRTGTDGNLHIIEEIKKALKKNYTVYLHVVFLDSSKEAWSRVKKRYEKIKRYVPRKDVEDSFSGLFPNLNKILNTSFNKRSYFIKLWYNSSLSGSNVSKALVIGGITVNYTISKNTLDDLLKNYLIFFEKKNHILYLFLKKRIYLLPNSAINQLDKLDLSKKWD